MPFSSGTFSRVHDWTSDRDAGIKISASRTDAEFDGIATALTSTMLKDGSQTLTAMIPFTLGLSVPTDKKLQLRDSNIFLNSSASGQADLVANSVIQVTAPTVNIEASTAITLESDAITLGENGDTDIVLTFNANSADGVITWKEDEDYFLLSDDILMNSTEKIQFGDTASFIQQSSDGVLRIDGEATIDLNASTEVNVSAALTVGGRIVTDDTTEATSTTDGSLQTDGGLSVAKDVVVGDDVLLKSDAAVVKFGADSDVTLTHVADTGLLLNSTMALQFNDASQSINAPSATVLDINATDEIELNATTIDLNGALDVSGTSTLAGDVTLSRAETDGTVRLNLSNTGSNGSSEFSEIKFNSTAGSTVTSIVQHRNNSGMNIGTTTNHPVSILQNNAAKLTTASTGIAVSGTVLSDRGTESAPGYSFSDDTDTGMFNISNADLAFSVGGDERLRINSSGMASLGTFNNVLAATGRSGINLFQDGSASFSSTAQPLYINRDGSDGELVRFFHDTNLEGNISVSGNTVSYNAFSGSHWSRLADNSKPTILKGTVVETIDEMCDWYKVEYEVDGKTHTSSISLPDGKKVGDTISFTVPDNPVLYDQEIIDKTYTGKIIKETDNKHTKCKVSDTADSKRVYGVFADWDADDDTVNDMYVTAVGTHVVRINKDVTVTAGDLLSSNGDGTAKVQDDDIIRSKTIGKVLTNIKQETYNDGSYTVPCALYCG